MSTEQSTRTWTATDPEVVAVVAEMRDGRSFGLATPRDWARYLRDVMPRVIASLANRRDELAEASDQAIGTAFDAGMSAEDVGYSSYEYNARTLEAFGAYLRAKAALFDQAPGGIPPFPERQIPVVVGHVSTYDQIKAWADNPEEDVQDSVDEQATYLREHLGADVWPQCCTSNGESKEFLGRAMDYKRARLAPLAPQTGMRLRVDEALNRGAYFALGQVVTVTDTPGTGGDYFAALGTVNYQNQSETRNLDNDQPHYTQSLFRSSLRQYHLVSEDVPESGTEPEPTAAEAELHVADTGEVEALRTQVATLRSAATGLEAALQQVRSDLQVERTRHEQDIATIGTALNDEARDRDWCEEYDRFVQRLNRNLTIPLPDPEDREQEYEVQVTGYLRVPFSYTVTVELRSGAESSDIEEAAADYFNENVGTRDLLRNYADSDGAEVEDDPDFEVQ